MIYSLGYGAVVHQRERAGGAAGDHLKFAAYTAFNLRTDGGELAQIFRGGGDAFKFSKVCNEFGELSYYGDTSEFSFVYGEILFEIKPRKEKFHEKQ